MKKKTAPRGEEDGRIIPATSTAPKKQQKGTKLYVYEKT